MNTLRTSVRTPFLCTDITYYYPLFFEDFSPIDDLPVPFTDSEEEVYIKNGFLASNASDTAGLLYVVTWDEYQTYRTQTNRSLVTNVQALAMCAGIPVYLTSGEWIETPIVKIFGQWLERAMPRIPGFPDYPVNIEYVNIGTIR
jgi:hypothetical protein